MKLRTVGAALLVAAAVMVMSGVASAACQLWEHAKWDRNGGRSFWVPNGMEVNWIGHPWNDRVSAVTTHGNCRLQAFQHKDYQGHSQFFTSTDFVGDWWNDQMSSFKCVCR